MDGQSNEQNNQNTNVNQPQQSGTQNGGGFPGFTGLFFPLNLIFRERPRSSPDESNTQQDGSQGDQQEQLPQIQFFVYPIPGAQGGDGQTTPGVFFFTPFFIPQQEVCKPRASESALKKLPIITVTKEHVDSQTSCPICLEPFPLSIIQEENKETNRNVPVRQMPCDHMFCESCLFQWLRQNNSCPLCRKEIEAEEAEVQQNYNNGAATNAPPLFDVMNIGNPPSTSPPSTTTNVVQSNSNSNSSHNSHSHSHSRSSSCVLENVGCCDEMNNDIPTPIITLPQCHHSFHASCLRTYLLVEGYSPGEFNSISQPLNFRCPTCRSPAIVQSDMLKMPTTPHDERQQEQQAIPFNLPITVNIPDSDDDMDLD